MNYGEMEGVVWYVHNPGEITEDSKPYLSIKRNISSGGREGVKN